MSLAKRILVVLVCLAIPGLPVLATGGQEAVPSEEVTLDFWHLWGGTREPILNDLLARFTAKHPNITIEQTFTPAGSLQEKLFNATGTGTLPDVFIVNSSWFINLFPEKTMLALDPFVRKGNLKLDQILFPLEIFRNKWNDKLHALSVTTSGAGKMLFYNKGLMRKAGLDPESPPTIWKELVHQSKTIVSELNSGGELDVVGWNPAKEMGVMVCFCYGNDAPVISADSKTAQLDTPGVIEVAKAFESYITDVYGAFGGYEALAEWTSRTIGVDTSMMVSGFVQEKEAFYISGSWTINQVREGNPDLDYGIVPVPGLKRQHGDSGYGGWSYGISEDCPHPEEAWEFVKFITIDPEGNGEFCKAQLRPCPIMAINRDPIYKQEMGELWDMVLHVMELDQASGNNFYTTLIGYLEDIPNRRMAGESTEEVLEDLNDDYQEYIDDIWSNL